MNHERQIKFRVEHRVGYEDYNWKVLPVSEVLTSINDIGFVLSVYGVIPPLGVLNQVLEKGKCDAGLPGLTVWQPLSLTIQEYVFTKKTLINHSEIEYFCDKELDEISDCSDWNKAVMKKYNSIPIDENKIINYLKLNKVKGMERCLQESHQIFMQRNKKWHRSAHITTSQEIKIKHLILDYVNNDGKYLHAAFAALSEFPDLEEKYRQWLIEYGKKDSRIGYFLALFLSRFNSESYQLPKDFYCRTEQLISHLEIDKLLSNL